MSTYERSAYSLKPVTFLIRDGDKDLSWGDTDNEEDGEQEESQKELMSKYLADVTSVFLKRFTHFAHEDGYKKEDADHLVALLSDVIKVKSFLSEDQKAGN